MTDEPSKPELAAELEDLRARLAEAEEVLRAIRNGEVDAVVVTGERGDQVFTLRGADRVYRQLIETMSEGAVALSANGVILYCNVRLAEILGLPLDHVLGTSLRDHLPIADQQAFDAILAQACTGTNRREINLITSEGRLVPVYLSASPLRSEGTEIGFCLVLTDLTEQKHHEQTSVAERLARLILEQAAEAIVVCDEAGRVIRLSEAAKLLCDDSPLMRPFAEAFPLRTNASEPFHLAPVFQGETLRNMDVTLDRQGQKLDLILNAGQLRSGPQFLGCIVTLTNVTERKRAAEALAQSMEQLRQSQKIEAVGRLAGGIAHDFNNLLTVIIGYCELMTLKIGAENPLREDVQEINKAADRAAALTRQLLAFSWRQILQPKVLEIDDVVPEMDKMLRRLISEDVNLVTNLGAGGGKVKVDPSQIEQVIVNLVINSRDAMPGGGAITIETAVVELDEAYVRKHGGAWPGPHIMLAVSDTGCGMDPETLSKAFDPFFTTKEKGKGTGLGLSTVFGIVKQSGGCLYTYSEPGRGTTMKIYLPRVTGETTPKDAKQDEGFDDRLQGSETILLVEDEETLRKLATSILEGYGYTVLSAGNGEEALQLLNDSPGIPSLLVTDVVMPKMGGKELSDRIKAIHPDTRILFMSGYTDNAIVHHGVLDPGVAYLAKPFTPKALARKVREVLDKA